MVEEYQVDDYDGYCGYLFAIYIYWDGVRASCVGEMCRTQTISEEQVVSADSKSDCLDLAVSIFQQVHSS